MITYADAGSIRFNGVATDMDIMIVIPTLMTDHHDATSLRAAEEYDCGKRSVRRGTVTYYRDRGTTVVDVDRPPMIRPFFIVEEGSAESRALTYACSRSGGVRVADPFEDAYARFAGNS